MNTPQPGSGTVQDRRPYPYMQQQWFDQSVGNSRYNALQITVNKRASHGSPTWLLTHCRIRTPTAADWAPAATLPIHTTAPRTTALRTSTRSRRFPRHLRRQSPFNTSSNKLVSNVAGGWSLNGIVQFSSGQPYTVTTGSDPENIGCCLQERLNVVGNPNSGPVSGPVNSGLTSAPSSKRHPIPTALRR